MIVLALIAVSHLSTPPQTREIYKDPDAPLMQRVDDLVGRMTLPEKIGQMIHGAGAIPRLGIPAYNWWSESLHGVARAGLATVFPQSIGLGASWDPELMTAIGTATSDEARAKHEIFVAKGERGIYQGLTFWAPNINIFRDPRWGRGQETYGEDPWLTSRMGVAFVKAMQGDDPKYLKVVATPKHYAVHSGPEPLRNRFNAVATKQDMFATYFPAFESCVKEANAWSVMSAYNRVNGLPCSGSPFLLQETLRDKWGFKGYVVSDCGAIYNIFQDHKVVRTAEEAAAMAVNAGCDLECGEAYQALASAVEKGLISEATIDKSVKRLFEARFRLGMFDPKERVAYRRISPQVVDSPKHKALALKAARESIVLLKNSGGLLPLKRVKTLAVIGPNARETEVLLGNYNGTPSHAVSMLEGIEKGAPKGTRVIYAKGSDLTEAGSLQAIPVEALRTPDGKRGLFGQYFNNTPGTGRAPLERVDSTVDFDWGEGAPGPGVQADDFKVIWTGKIVAPRTGTYRIGVRNDDGMRLWLDDKLLIDDWTEHGPQTTTKEVQMAAGGSYRIRLEYFERKIGAVAKLLWAPPGTGVFDDAVAAARKADAVVMCLGINGEIENEGVDRDGIELPKIQRQLLQAVAKVGKPVIVVLINGGPITLDPPEKNVAAILEAWYPGQAGGTAVADVLFGRYNPGGRLPVTIYRSMADVPEFTDYSMKGRTYRYFTGKPLYPFGYGLSYTTFAYSDLRLMLGRAPGGPEGASVLVNNGGKVDGDEVVQLYVTRAGSGGPVRELKAFKRVHLKPGESKRVVLPLEPRSYSVVEKDGSRWVRPGVVEISIGGGQPGFAKTLRTKVRLTGKAARLE